jgi:uncharacterized protein (TIGR02147 family)
MNEPYYQQILNETLAQRCRKNPRYSLRAFAQSMGLDAGNLSRAMRGQTSLSKVYSEKIVNELELSPKQREVFYQSLKQHPKAKRKKPANNRKFDLIEQKHFEIIADLVHYAILELTATERFQSDVNWIARALDKNPAEIRLAVGRLFDTGYLIEEKGIWKKSTPKIKTRGGLTTSSALRSHQKQSISGALKAVDLVDISKRTNISLTMPIDPQKMDLARQHIEQYAQDLCELLTDGKRKQVYQLSVSLYPLQKESSV